MTTTARRDPLAYNRETADERFWTEHWEAETLRHLLAVAATSQLTAFLARYVRPGRRVLEAGCGLGQYVRYFAERGVDIVGVDYSRAAIDRHLAEFTDSNVREADLRELPFEDDAFDVYVSLGVIEHLPDGPGAILAEARRVLAPGGDLIVSTPFLNLSRRALRRRIEREQTAVAQTGGAFYQYAFDRDTLDELLMASGFEVTDRSYYDPGRGLRDIRSLVARRDVGARSAPAAALRAPRRHSRLARAVLYSRPFLSTVAHMQIVRARHAG